LHRGVAELLRDDVAGAAEPELLAHHFSQANMIETAVEWWGKAGHKSLERSALVEAAQQFTRGLDQIATLPATPALRREEINLQVALISPLIHVKGYAAPETKAAVERARQLIEQAEALGEPPEDPLLLFFVLYGLWTAAFVSINCDMVVDLARQFMSLAKKQGRPVPLLVAHRIMGVSLMLIGDLEGSRAHFDHGIALYDPAQHRPLAARFGHDLGVAALTWRSPLQWLCGRAESATADANQALNDARESGHVGTLMYCLGFSNWLPINFLLGNYAAASAQAQELLALAGEKNASFWIGPATMFQGCILAATGKTSDAVQMIASGLTASQATGNKMWLPLYTCYLAKAYAELGKFADARRCVDEATLTLGTTQETMFEAEVRRIAGEIEMLSPESNAAKAEACFERALMVARGQQARSWELRATMSMARLWRSQGKRDEARDLLAPIYNWFTEDFDTADLKEAKALLGELAF